MNDLALTDIAPGQPPVSNPPSESMQVSLEISDPDDLDENPVGAIFTDGSYRGFSLIRPGHTGVVLEVLA